MATQNIYITVNFEENEITPITVDIAESEVIVFEALNYGIDGTSGYSGWSGTSGYSGVSAWSGFSGNSGWSGWSGWSGYGESGYSGISAWSGFSGSSGYSGVSAWSGWSGDSGYSGVSAWSGYSGESGYSGVSAWSGWSGDSGYSGVSAWSGFSGESGFSGTSGFSGVSGFSGAAVSTTGTSGYLAKFISPTEIANGPVYVDGSNNVGIGIDAPTAQLHLVKADSSALTDFLINPTLKAGGNLIDAQVGGVSKFKVDNTGRVMLADGAAALPALSFISNPDTGIWYAPTNIFIGVDGTEVFRAYANKAIYLGGTSTGSLEIDPTNTTINATTAGATLQLNTKPSGTAGSTKVLFGSSTDSQTSGTNTIVSITPTYNQATGTAANTDLLISRTQTAVGSGAQLLIDAQVGGVSKFKVDNTGTLTIKNLSMDGTFTQNIFNATPSANLTGYSQLTLSMVNVTDIFGLSFIASQNGATSTSVYGILGEANLSAGWGGTATATNVYAFFGKAGGSGAGATINLTNAYTFYAQNYSPSGVANPTNYYQFYAEKPTRGSATNYAYYSAGGKIYFDSIDLNAASGNEVAFTLNYTTNKVAGNDTGLKINQTDTVSPGTSYLIDAQVGGVSKFFVRNDGLIAFDSGFVNYISPNSSYLTFQTHTYFEFNTIVDNATINSTYMFNNSGTRALTAASGSQSFFKIGSKVNQSGTAGATDLLINRTQTAVGSGAQLLIDAQVGSATKFKVDNTGKIYTPSVDISVAGSSGRNVYSPGYITIENAQSFVIRGLTTSYGGDHTQVQIGDQAQTNTAGNRVVLNVVSNYNQASGTAANTDLLISRTQTAVGSGAQLLIDAQVGGVSKFKVTNAGAISVGGGGTAAINLPTAGYSIGVGGTSNYYIYIGGGRGLWYQQSIANSETNPAVYFDSNSVQMTGANIAQTYMKLNPIYNQTGTAGATDLLINRTQTAVGSGAQLLIDAQVGGVSKWYLDNTGSMTFPASAGFTINNGSGRFYDIWIGGGGNNIWTTSNTSMYMYPLGASTIDKFLTIGQNAAADRTYTQTSGANSIVRIVPTYNQATGTAANTDLLINRTETAVGSGAQLLIDAQVGGVSKYNVSNVGTVTNTGGYIKKVTTVTDTYGILATDYTVVCNKSTAFTVTLPTATVGQIFNIKNINTGVVTVEGKDTDTIDGELNQDVDQWECLVVQCSAANTWVIL